MLSVLTHTALSQLPQGFQDAATEMYSHGGFEAVSIVLFAVAAASVYLFIRERSINREINSELRAIAGKTEATLALLNQSLAALASEERVLSDRVRDIDRQR